MSKKNKNYFKKDDKSSKSLALDEQNMALRPPDDGGGDPPIDPPPQGDQSSPVGVFDSVDSNTGYASGWSYDPDNPSLSNDVHIYIGGPAGGGGVGYATTANQPRPDVNQAFGIGGDHGFRFQIPAQYADGQQYPVYAYGIDTGANNPTLLQGSPKYFIINSPNNPAVSLNQVSPIAGALAGGISITLTGSGFQPGAAVYFGNAPATQVTVESGEVIHATLPASSGAGSVAVSVINPDGSSASIAGGFTYVTGESGQQAEVLGVTPLAVIEDTTVVVTIRGRNLIAAYNDGLLALRGPSRCHITSSGTTANHDAASGIDTVQMTVSIQCTPALQPLERMAIQVLASRRAEAATDGVVESSKQMFTVLPKAVPVALAYTANLDAGKPNLVMVSGRNLDGHSLALDDGTEVAFQNNDGNFLSGIVTLPENVDTSAPLQLSMLDSGGTKVAGYQIDVAPDGGFASLSSEQNFASLAPPSGDALALNLTPVANQQFIGPTANDSAAFNIASGSPFGFGFNWNNFAITIVDVTIILPIVNDVYLIPFFDGGGDTLNSPVEAEVGEIFRLRGAGLLVAIRVEVEIHIQLALIIGFYYQIWDYGFYNEFPEFSYSIGSVVIGIEIYVEVIFYLSALVALVKPNGQLEVLAAVNLTLGIDFSIDGNGHLHFDPEFTYSATIIGINPVANNPLPCGGKFQLVSADNGRTAFLDSIGGYEAYYFVREADECCVPWDFNMQLVRFSSGGQQEIVQSEFQASYCVTATESPNYYDVVITSEPPPVGIPPTLVMNIGETATLKALAVPVDSNGNPTGAPAQDLKDLGYDVEFFLAQPADQVLDPTVLPPGQANAILEGSNLIRAAVTSVRVSDSQLVLAFWKNSIYGFRQGATSGEAPRLIAGGLPITVNSNAITIEVTPVLAYEETTQDGQKKLVEALPFTNNFSIPIWEMKRDEPFETQRDYFLAVKINVPANTTLPGNTILTFKVDKTMDLEIFEDDSPKTRVGSPLGIFGDNRISQRPEDFFTGDLIIGTSGNSKTINLALPSGAINSDNLFKVGTVIPNVKEGSTTDSPKKLVPPGKAVDNVLLKIPLHCSANKSVKVSSPDKTLNIVPTNNETFEEYLRVLKPVDDILKGTSASTGAYFENFGNNLLTKLNSTANSIEDELKAQGKALWDQACQLVSSGYLDDRPLYWARLQGIGAIRAYYRNKNNSDADQAILNKFEYTSRGLDENGVIQFPATASAGMRKAIITGFDPFQLVGSDENIKTSNPSGLSVLKFNEKPFPIPNQESVYVKSAVFPVRYKDFNEGIVEAAIKPSLGSITMIVSISENGNENYYDLERWAARFRLDDTDNNNKKGTSERMMPSVIPVGSEYLESTLPLEMVITSAEEIEAPNGTAPFVIDQSYNSIGSSKTITERRDAEKKGILPPPYDPKTDGKKFRPEPLETDAGGHNIVADTPEGNSYEGSGGNFLSNEIFYRIALVRAAMRNKLATGHFHVPSTDSNPNDSNVGGKLINGVKTALERLFAYGFRLSGNNTSIDFSQVVANTSAEKMLTVTNNSTEALKISSIEATTPFSVVLPNTISLPITVNSGDSLTLTIKFSPSIAGLRLGKLTLRESSGEELLIIDLSGIGIQNQSLPVIASFSPITVHSGESLTIYGQNFNGVTSVRIGDISIPFTVDNATQITAQITGNVSTGTIYIDTPSGTVASSTTLSVSSPTPTPNTADDAVADFSATNNPTGVWSYGYETVSGSSFTPFTNNGQAYGSGIDSWSPNAGGVCCAMLVKNATGATQTYAGTIVQPADLLNLHPGANGEKSVVRWTAPSAGTYQVAGRFQGLDTGGTTTDVHILHNHQEVWANNIDGFGAQAAFSLTVTVNAGDTLDFEVGFGSNNTYNNDSTGLAAVITPSGSTPTPTPTITPTPTPPPASGNSAIFKAMDSTTQGNWIGTYGGQGYTLYQDATNLPNWAQMSLGGQQENSYYTDNSFEQRALQRAANNGQRFAAVWQTPSVATFAFNFTDGQSHQLALYCLDWDGNNYRTGQLEILDGATEAVLDTRTTANLSSGVYFVWQVKGQVTVRLTNTNAYNAQISAFFIDAPAATPTPPPAPPATNNYPPKGWFDGIDSNLAAKGWSFDPDNSSDSNKVRFYIDGAIGVGTLIGEANADEPRPDVNQAYGITGNHGFAFQIPSRYADARQHYVHAYGVDTTTGELTQIGYAIYFQSS